MTAHLTTSAEPRQWRKCVWLAISGTVLAALVGGAVYWLIGLPTGDTSQERRTIASSPPWFADRTESSGVSFTYRNGEEADHLTILESLGGGVALFDYDGDGLLDIFVTGGGFFDKSRKDYPEDARAYQEALRTAPPLLKGHPCKLYKNLGNWKFRDVTAEVGLEGPWWYTHGVAVADYDCDGWPDLLVTGYGKLALFHNESDGKGGRRFVDVTAKVGLRDDSWSTSAGWADLDGDGFPDLYVCHYLDWSFANHPLCKSIGSLPDVCAPQRFKPLVHALFHNEKGKAFRNISAEQGFRAAGYGLGVALADLNDDGRPDIYVANDASNNFLFLNRGGQLEEKGLEARVAVGETGVYSGSMGLDVGDYDCSGRASVWVTNYQGELHALFLNLGREIFDYRSRSTGIGAIGMRFVGFGTGFLDADNDGWEDLVIVNGHVLRHPTLGSSVRQRPVLFHNEENQGRRFFRDTSAQGGPFFQNPAVGRGLAIGDLDNDGWPDLVVSHTNSPVVLLHNEAAAASDKPAHWLGVRLVGRDYRDVVGSTVIVEGGERRLTRFARGGGSYLSAGDPRLLFGLGSSKQLRRVTVKWSWGRTQTWDNLQPDIYWELHEGRERATAIARRTPSP